MSDSVTKAIRKARQEVDELLPQVPVGKFLQIDRIGRRTGASVAMVAYRNTGDIAEFTRQINRMFTDASDALQIGQELRVEITD